MQLVKMVIQSMRQTPAQGWFALALIPALWLKVSEEALAYLGSLLMLSDVWKGVLEFLWLTVVDSALYGAALLIGRAVIMGKKVSFIDFYRGIKYLPKIALSMLVICTPLAVSGLWLLVGMQSELVRDAILSVFFVLLLFPLGIFVLLRTAFAAVYIVEEQVSVIDAIKASWTRTREMWPQIGLAFFALALCLKMIDSLFGESFELIKLGFLSISSLFLILHLSDLAVQNETCAQGELTSSKAK